MIYLKKTSLTMLRLIVSDVKKSKNNRKKVKENKKIGAIPKARGFSHVRDRRGAMKMIERVLSFKSVVLENDVSPRSVVCYLT